MKSSKLFIFTCVTLLLGICACDQIPCPELEANKETVRKFSEAVNQLDYNALDAIVLPNFVRHSQATPDVAVKSLEEFKQFVKINAEVMPDMKGEILMMAAEGELVAAYVNFTGTQTGPMGPFPASGKKMESKTMAFFRLQDGNIAELWIEWDNLATLTQLGHFPPTPPAVAE